MQNHTRNTQSILFTLWIFISVNYIFCDVFSLYHSKFLKQLLNGGLDGIEFTQKFLLTFAILMEIPMAMIVLSKFLKYKWNKPLNLFSGILMLIIQLGSLITGSNSLHYIFFSIIEISTLLGILIVAWKWKVNSL